MVTCKSNENTLIICVDGKIDSVNADTVEKEINDLRMANAHTAAELNLSGLEYISSAGLRVILRLRKAEPSLRITEVSSEVYDILDMTGFAEMIPVTKAFRKVSVEGCEVIGKGANGEVYRLDPETIIKVYLDPDSLPDIKRERELARRAFVLGIPTAIPYDVVKTDLGYGSVFELLNADPFAKLMKNDPDHYETYIREYVDLMKKIHSTEVLPDDMPDMRDVAIDWAEFLKDYLPPEDGEKLVKLVKDVPVMHTMLHGDYHVKNVMRQNDEVLLIDMDTLCQGHPVFELASAYNAYVGFSVLDHGVVERFLGIPFEITEKIWKDTLKLYLGTDDEEKLTAVENKAKLLGFVRLMRRLIRRNGLNNETDRKLIEYYKAAITEILKKTDTLLF